jgi:hypothetical protein
LRIAFSFLALTFGRLSRIALGRLLLGRRLSRIALGRLGDVHAVRVGDHGLSRIYRRHGCAWVGFIQLALVGKVLPHLRYRVAGGRDRGA